MKGIEPTGSVRNVQGHLGYISENGHDIGGQ